MIARGTTSGKIVHAGEAGKITARDKRAPRHISEVTWKLCPEGRFQCHLLAHRNQPKVGECRLHFRDTIIEIGLAVRADGNGKVVFAKGRSACREIITRETELAAQAQCFIIGCPHPPEHQIDPAECRLSIDEAETLRNGQFVWKTQQIVEHTGRRLARIILDGDDRCEAPWLTAVRCHFDGVSAEAYTA